MPCGGAIQMGSRKAGGSGRSGTVGSSERKAAGRGGRPGAGVGVAGGEVEAEAEVVEDGGEDDHAGCSAGLEEADAGRERGAVAGRWPVWWGTAREGAGSKGRRRGGTSITMAGGGVEGEDWEFGGDAGLTPDEASAGGGAGGGGERAAAEEVDVEAPPATAEAGGAAVEDDGVTGGGKGSRAPGVFFLCWRREETAQSPDSSAGTEREEWPEEATRGEEGAGVGLRIGAEEGVSEDRRGEIAEKGVGEGSGFGVFAPDISINDDALKNDVALSFVSKPFKSFG